MSASPRALSEDGEASDSAGENVVVVNSSESPARSVTREVSERSERSEDKEDKKKERKKKHKHRHDKDSEVEAGTSGDEEERLRRRLIEKKEKEDKKKHRRTSAGDEEDELFTIQPGDQKRAKDKEKEREREKERDKREERDERRPERTVSERDRRDPPKSFHDRRDDRRRDDKWNRPDPRDRWRDDRRGPPPGRDQRVDPRDIKKRVRSRSRSRSSEVKKREKRDDEKRDRDRKRGDDRDKERKDKGKEKEKEKEHKVSKETEKVEVQKSEEEITKVTVEMEVVETISVHVEEMEADVSTTPEPPVVSQSEKIKKYSKFESSPESDVIQDSPFHSEYSDHEEPIEEELEEDEPLEESVDLSEIPFEELTDEQKARLSPDSRSRAEKEWQQMLVSQLPVYFPGINGCRNVIEFDCLNRIEEGTFGVVYRAKDKRTDEVVALKRLKMEKEKEGFPITSLREVNMLLKAGGHENVVNVKEIVIGSNMDKIFLVMEFVEHDMKSLMETMHRSGKKFTIGEVKTLTMQLLSGMKHLHDLWILHRDLKTSNLLLSHKSVLKIGDFGLAREYGEPLKEYTQVVVTLWYRSPELLLGIKRYSTAVDMWSVGCIMAEFLLLKPLFPGRGEADQVNKIFTELGTPNEKVWPGYNSLPGPKQVAFVQHDYNQLRKKFPANMLHETGFRLLQKLLMYDPEKRISASDALENDWFIEDPQPTAREMFPTWPAKSELNKKPPVDHAKKAAQTAAAAPLPNISASHAKLLTEMKVRLDQAPPQEFSLKF